MRQLEKLLVFSTLLSYSAVSIIECTFMSPPARHVNHNQAKLNIIGGFEVKPHSFPFAVYLGVNVEGQIATCGGSLISPNYVLTAGHCLADFHGKALGAEVVLGGHNITIEEPGTQRIKVERSGFILHENFRFPRNDIALLKLPHPVSETETIRFAKLPSVDEAKKDLTGEKVIALGWGSISNDDEIMSSVLKGADLQVTPRNECKMFYVRKDMTVTEDNICANGLRPEGSCSGDSGSPLLFGDKLIGATSRGPLELCSLGTPTIYVDFTKHLEWIHGHINRTNF